MPQNPKFSFFFVFFALPPPKLLGISGHGSEIGYMIQLGHMASRDLHPRQEHKVFRVVLFRSSNYDNNEHDA